MNPVLDPVAGQRASVAVRNQRGEIVRGLKEQTLTLRDVLLDPHPSIADELLFDVLLWQRGFGRNALRRLNLKAMPHGVNLAVTVERASLRTRMWVAEHGEPMCRRVGA